MVFFTGHSLVYILMFSFSTSVVCHVSSTQTMKTDGWPSLSPDYGLRALGPTVYAPGWLWVGH